MQKTVTNSEFEAVHKRLRLANLRIAHIEHYLGLRRHDFEVKDMRWRYAQAQEDIPASKTPVETESLYNK